LIFLLGPLAASAPGRIWPDLAGRGCTIMAPWRLEFAGVVAAGIDKMQKI
jgi:hypothetical protein